MTLTPILLCSFLVQYFAVIKLLLKKNEAVRLETFLLALCTLTQIGVYIYFYSSTKNTRSEANRSPRRQAEV